MCCNLFGKQYIVYYFEPEFGIFVYSKEPPTRGKYREVIVYRYPFGFYYHRKERIQLIKKFSKK